MRCQEIRELLSPYYDNMLDETQRIRVEQHLQGCEQCRQELEELKFVIELMQGSAEVLAPEGFSRKVMARVASPSAAEVGANGSAGQGWLRRWGRVAAVAAMLVAAVVIGIEVNEKGYFASNLSPLSVQKADKSQSQVGMPEVSPAGDEGDNPAGKVPAMLKEAKNKMATDGPGGHIASNSMPAGPGVQYDMAQPSVAGAPQALGSSAQERLMPGEARGPMASGGMGSKTEGGKELQRKDNAAVERKLITNGRVQVEVTDFDSAYSGIIKTVEKFRGYVENSTFSNSPQGTPPEEQYRSGRLTVRVPAGQFNAFLEEIKKVGTVVFREMRSQDVSAEFYDTQARIRNWKQQEARLLEILKQAKNVDEILRVEGELQRVRQEVEIMEGRIKTMGNLSEMAALEVELTQVKSKKVIQVPEGKNVFQRSAEAFIGTVNDLLALLEKSVVFLGGLAPVLIVLAVAVGLFLTFRHRKRGNPPGGE
ncbi:MAG: DUF4349 domain-containing protein [Clostridia bacterium]|nr:DUF4349 domain-containing protein [Clostridia bacterium]